MPNPIIDAAIAQIAATEDTLASAKLFATNVPGWIDTAVQKALANGATAAELQPLTQLSADLKAKTQETADAIVANTPAAP